MSKFYTVIFLIILTTAAFLRVGDYAQSHGKVVMGEVKVKVEVVREPAEMAKGLGGRDGLEENHGMLFVFETPGEPAFWMKDMKFPIDIIWIMGDEVVDIAPNLPVVAAEFLSTYQPKEPANYVLEVNAGFVKEHGIKVGDSIEIKI